MTDSELLALVAEERKRSIGFDHDAQLVDDRAKALNYIKGEMPDVPALPNRSKAVSHDISDAIETVLPDLIEIFTGGDDVVSFIPQGPEDEAAAQQETDYLQHVVFNENDGFLVVYSMIKDALQVKTGVVKYCWEDGEETEERLEGKSVVAMSIAAQNGEIVEAEPCEPKDAEGYDEPLFDFTVRRKSPGRVAIMAVPPEDFTVAADVVSLRDATYCAMRSRPRAQDLLADGYDEDKIAALQAYGAGTGTVELARDTVDESAQSIGDKGLRRVEVVEHYIRVWEGKKKLYRLVTGNDETILLEKEEVDAIPFAAITPYIVTHRFYGESVADRLMEIQRINTALTRMGLDSGYFALNARLEVDEQKASANTIPDLLRNEPGVPIRVKTGGAVQAINTAPLSFDVFGALEYFQTKSEQRTGIVRNAQGLSPDTLHETAKGMLALYTAAQKRVRLIARIFAETGIKDLFLGVHALLRKHAEQKAVVRLRNKWTEIDPTSWGERSDMSIEIGLGAAGKEQEVAALEKEGIILQEVIALQGGASGPIVTIDNVYNFAKRSFEKLGNKAPEKFLTDPQGQQPQAQPDPKVLQAQAQLQLQQQDMQAKQQLAQQQAVLDAQTNAVKLQQAHEHAMGQLAVKQQQAEADITRKFQQLQAELELKRQELQAEVALNAAKLQADAALGERQQAHKESMALSDVKPGGEPG